MIAADFKTFHSVFNENQVLGARVDSQVQILYSVVLRNPKITQRHAKLGFGLRGSPYVSMICHVDM